jgi:hypothetical protein
VQRHDRLPRPRRARDAGRPTEVALHELALRGMQEHDPPLPRVLERALQLLDVLDDPEAPLRIRVLKRVDLRADEHRFARPAAGGELEQRLSRFTRQAVDQREQLVLAGGEHVVQPLGRHAVAEQVVLRDPAQRRSRRRRGRRPWRDPLRSVRSHRESYRPHMGKEDNRSDGTRETPAYAGADHQEVA